MRQQNYLSANSSVYAPSYQYSTVSCDYGFCWVFWLAFFQLTLYCCQTDCCSVIFEKVSTVGCCHLAQVGSCHFQLMRYSFNVDDSLPFRYCYWLNCLLFLAGDIVLNPGPVRFLCNVCAHLVCTSQCGIQCDGCNKWTHASCSDVSADLYKQMEAWGGIFMALSILFVSRIALA